MTKKETRIKQFLELETLFNSGLYDDLNIQPAELITQSCLSKLNISNKTPQSIVLKQESVINTIQETQNAAVLVFCSAQNPGGGILRGSVAQEEEIAMHSSWYFQVKDLDIFYKKNKDKRDSLNSERVD